MLSANLMGVYFEQYWDSLWRDIPLYVFESLAVVFCIGAVALLALKGLKGGRYVSGVLLGLSFRSMTWLRALLIGTCLSIGIEALQFIFIRGFSELDDVMHNTLGCVIGYGLFRLLSHLTQMSQKGLPPV